MIFSCPLCICERDDREEDCLADPEMPKYLAVPIGIVAEIRKLLFFSSFSPFCFDILSPRWQRYFCAPTGFGWKSLQMHRIENIEAEYVAFKATSPLKNTPKAKCKLV